VGGYGDGGALVRRLSGGGKKCPVDRESETKSRVGVSGPFWAVSAAPIIKHSRTSYSMSSCVFIAGYRSSSSISRFSTMWAQRIGDQMTVLPALQSITENWIVSHQMLMLSSLPIIVRCLRRSKNLYEATTAEAPIPRMEQRLGICNHSFPPPGGQIGHYLCSFSGLLC
jgi:hypothetical protein